MVSVMTSLLWRTSILTCCPGLKPAVWSRRLASLSHGCRGGCFCGRSENRWYRYDYWMAAWCSG